MFLKYLFFLSVFTFVFYSCKKTDVSGVVYSKHNIPVSNADVKIYWSIGGDTKTEGTVCSTDNLGRYSISFKSKRGRAYTVSCECDSGKKWEPVKEKTTNVIDLYLY